MTTQVQVAIIPASEALVEIVDSGIPTIVEVNSPVLRQPAAQVRTDASGVSTIYVGLAQYGVVESSNGWTIAAEAASAVRTELTTELGRIDTSISSRLAPGGTLARVTLADTVTTLTNAPDVPTESEIADAVRTELTTELSRLSNAATVQNVADIVEGAFSLPET